MQKRPGESPVNPERRRHESAEAPEPEHEIFDLEELEHETFDLEELEHETFDLEEPAPKPKSVKCPTCGTRFPGQAGRPAMVECPNCGTKGTLK